LAHEKPLIRHNILGDIDYFFYQKIDNFSCIIDGNWIVESHNIRPNPKGTTEELYFHAVDKAYSEGKFTFKSPEVDFEAPLHTT
jgi:hypothetical protein